MAPYSSRNKVPTIERLGKELAERLNLQNKAGSRATSRKESDKIGAAKAASRRRVIDPTTKNEVVIQDVDADFEAAIRRPKITVPKAAIDSRGAPSPNDLTDDLTDVPEPHLPQGAGEEYRQILDDLAPPEANTDKTKDLLRHSKNKPVIYHPLPIADLKESFYSLEKTVDFTTVVVIASIVCLNWLFVHRGFKGFIASIFAGLIISVGMHLWLRNVQERANAVIWDSERRRAIAATESLVPESVEWLNSLVGIIWSLINPEMFASIADTLEDVMQASVPPSLIHNVRVSSIGLGDQPIHVLSLRSLPSVEEVEGNRKPTSTGNELSPEDLEKKQEQREIEGEDDKNLKYYNLELSFAYHAVPATGVVGKAKNLHIELIFYLGVQGLFGVPLPVFVELNGIIGRVRLRFQLTPNPPFLKNLTFTFMGLPKIDASAVPLTSKGINVLDLPLISKFVNSSIAAALDMYVAPKSLIMDMSKVLQGDAVKKETDAMGLIYINIKKAVGIAAQDRSGKSDPFITLAFSQFGKPVYCTRIIEQELDPFWNEQTCLLIYQDQLTAGEKLSVELWDSDTITSDDIVGKVEFELRDLVKDYENTISERQDELFDDKGKKLPGTLYWDIGYFPRSEFKQSMKTDGKDVTVPEEIRHNEEFADDKGTVTTQEEANVTTIPPDPSHPTGICSVLIHQIDNLEEERPLGSFKSYKPWTPAQIAGENTDEEAKELPSAYVSILQNDELVFKTRTKVRSSSPMFNAQTERFVRDWRNTVFTVTCWNSVYREHNPILGTVTLKLSDILRTSSQKTASYALDGGMGYGRIMISVLFRSVDLRLPRNMLGWDLGSLEVLGDKVVVENDKSGLLSKARISIHTDVGHKSISRAWIESDGSGVSWNLLRIKQGETHLHKHRVIIPVRRRYQTAIRLEFFNKGNPKPIAYSVYWLCDLSDNTETTLILPVYKTPMPKQMTQNYIKDIDRDKIESERVGTIKLTVRFKMGMDESHRQWIKTDNDRETFESWQTAVAEGYRTRVVKRETPETVKDLVNGGNGTSSSRTKSKDYDTTETADSDEEDTYADGNSPVVRLPREAPSFEKEIDEHDETSGTDQWTGDFGQELSRYISQPSSIVSDDSDGLEVQEDLTDSEIDDEELKKRRQQQDKIASEAELDRKQRGLRNIKGLRHIKFLKDEVKVAGHKIKHKVGMHGKEPQVETEL